MGGCCSKPQAIEKVQANTLPLEGDAKQERPGGSEIASLAAISEVPDPLPAAGISFVGPGDQGRLGETVKDLLDSDLFTKLIETSRALFKSVARRHPALKEVSSLLEQWNNVETILMPKLDELWTKLKQPDSASGDWGNWVQPIAAAVAGIMDAFDQVANTHPILKLAWLAVTTAYKLAKDKAESEDAFMTLVGEFQGHMKHVSSLVSSSTSGLTEGVRSAIKTTLTKYISGLIQLVDTCSDYDSSVGVGGWKAKFESILVDLKAKEDQLSKTEGTAALAVSTATHGVVTAQTEILVSIQADLKSIKGYSTGADDVVQKM
ncbi:hypothetical protein HDU99_003955 [Rhizoclosmatium hyalinum]|nr:hypothetical protein HDU99_003955 [Rhizoclosmatium hyalinum]